MELYRTTTAAPFPHWWLESSGYGCQAGWAGTDQLGSSVQFAKKCPTGWYSIVQTYHALGSHRLHADHKGHTSLTTRSLLSLF